ncbi:MAG: PEP-CTERM sorting domain-containing protein [Gammaproteobacteria bacterium]
MRKHLLLSAALVLAAGLGLVSFGASATAINVNLSSCDTLASCSANNLTFNGLEFDSGAFTSANLNYKFTSGNPVETGLGVTCNQTTPIDACSQGEIGSSPWQLIDVDISQLTGFSSVTLGLGSVNNSSFPVGTPETAYLVGSDCNIPFQPCMGVTLGSYTYDGVTATATFNFTAADLAPYTNIWITPQLSDMSGTSNANILLSSFTINTVTVPEPAVLGMFGLGILLIGLFAGLRRRMH